MNVSTLGRLAYAAWAVALASGAVAQDRRVGDWSVGLMKGSAGTYAATVNDSGGLLGQYCYREQGSCIWVVANDVTCDAGSRYPILVNTDAGAAILEILCVNVEGKARYAFTNFDAIDGIVHKAKRIGMAFPMANGHFHVSRFSLDGAPRAVAAMREVAEAMIPVPSGATAGFTF